ncbi:DNA polymerase III subunit beta [Bryobacterales bacterium F-183]|nr:DNA polymerase III subunit beta [Bryobacterales bacterium F-183]
MEFTVNKADLVRELSLSQGVVEKKTTIPILSNVLVEASGDRIFLTATDLELGIRCSCAAKVKKQGSGTIPAKRLLDYVRLLPDAPLDIKLGDNHWITITCGRSKTRIAGMSRESFPELPQMPDTLAKIPVAAFSTMIGRTIFAISNEESRFTLNGALLLLRDSAVTMVSTDGHRLSMVQNSGIDLGGASYRALLPKKAMGEILKLGSDAAEDGAFEFSGDENHLFFRLGDRMLMSRKLTGNFPDYERVLPKEQPNEIALAREEFRGSIERVAQFSDERSRAIRVRISTGELKIFSSISETGESEENLPIEYSGANVEIGFNAAYLLDFLKAVPPGDIKFLFKDGNSAGEYRPGDAGEGNQYRYVVMPMRI